MVSELELSSHVEMTPKPASTPFWNQRKKDPRIPPGGSGCETRRTPDFLDRQGGEQSWVSASNLKRSTSGTRLEYCRLPEEGDRRHRSKPLGSRGFGSARGAVNHVRAPTTLGYTTWAYAQCAVVGRVGRWERPDVASGGAS